VLARTLLHLPKLDRRELQRALYLFGVKSLPLALGTGALIGSTVVLQAGVYASKYGVRQYTGWAAGYALVWEFGPLLLGLMLAARIGARNAAELALLSVNGQIEGLRGISLDPFRILVVPRVIACAVSVTALSTLTFLVAIAWEGLSASFTLKLPIRVFFGSFEELLGVGDLAGGVIKSLAFGTAIALVSTAVGLRATGGARGVGQAAASAVVLCCGTIFALDFLITPGLMRAFGP
jgi:phospholipid/cholesterol/gamma-HCH transport system permease protein